MPMAKKKREKAKQPKTAGRARLLFLFAVLLSGSALYVLRCEIVAGVRTYFLGIGSRQIETAVDLPAGPKRCSSPCEVVGIPDYANVFHAEPRGGGRKVTCFRIVSFENRLLVCTPKGLPQPRDIEEIIQKKRFSGALGRLDRSPLEASIRREFREKTGEGLPRDAFLLEVGKSAVPSARRFASLGFLAVVCFFSVYRAIKS